MAIRSERKAVPMSWKPVFSGPTRWLVGTRTSVKDSSAVSDERQPILSSLRDTSKPGMPRSITMREIPLAPRSSGPPVRTAVVTKSARHPEVMKVLDPLTT